MIISAGRRNGKTLEMLKQAMKENELLGEALKNARREIAMLKSENKEQKEQLEKYPVREDLKTLVDQYTGRIIDITICGCKRIIDAYKDGEDKIEAEEVKKAIDRLKESEEEK